MEIVPLMIENRDFVALEEEDIQRLNRAEAFKFEKNHDFIALAASVESKYGPGEWNEHWVTVDDSGKRVYARVFSSDLHTLALTSDGKIIRQLA
jgi:hypothetical protein